MTANIVPGLVLMSLAWRGGPLRGHYGAWSQVIRERRLLPQALSRRAPV